MKTIIKPYALVKLHPEVLSIPFLHRKELSTKFRDVLGLLYLDYISIEIINPNAEYLYFSALPAVNFNLIENHLWPYDGAMSPTFYQHYSFYTWASAYQTMFCNELKIMKEREHGFHYGFVLVRKINQFYLLYSFATKNKNSEINLFFDEQKNELLKMGDYCYKLIRPLYMNYAAEYMPPIITNFVSFAEGIPTQAKKYSHLTLVVNQS